MADEDDIPDVVLSGASGDQEDEATEGEVLPAPVTKAVFPQNDVPTTLTGLADGHAGKMGGIIGAQVIQAWSHEQRARERALEEEKGLLRTRCDELQQQLTESKVRVAELNGVLSALRDQRHLRLAAVSGGTGLVGVGVALIAGDENFTLAAILILIGLVAVAAGWIYKIPGGDS